MSNSEGSENGSPEFTHGQTQPTQMNFAPAPPTYNQFYLPQPLSGYYQPAFPDYRYPQRTPPAQHGAFYPSLYLRQIPQVQHGVPYHQHIPQIQHGAPYPQHVPLYPQQQPPLGAHRQHRTRSHREKSKTNLSPKRDSLEDSHVQTQVDTPEQTCKTSREQKPAFSPNTGKAIQLLPPELRFRITSNNIVLGLLPPERPETPEVIKKPTEKIAVGITLDGINNIKMTKSGKSSKTRGGKLVYLTIYNFTLEPEKTTQAPKIYVHDESGARTSEYNIAYLDGYQTQEAREAAAMKLAERYRVARNTAIIQHTRNILEWRKARKLWEHAVVLSLWPLQGRGVEFPPGASQQIINTYAPIMKNGVLTYDTDEEPENETDATNDQTDDEDSENEETRVDRSIKTKEGPLSVHTKPAAVLKSRKKKLSTVKPKVLPVHRKLRPPKKAIAIPELNQDDESQDDLYDFRVHTTY